MNAPSPGIIALFQPNEYYPSLDEYLEAIGEAMKTEYEAIVAAGFMLQIDSPDLAMGRHIMYRDRSDEEFVAAAARHVEAINHALRDIPADSARLHLCWGNYEGPHHLDIDVGKIVDVVLRAKPADDPVRGGEPAPRARMGGVARGGHPGRQDPRPGRDRLDLQLHRAPGAGGAADASFAEIVGADRVMAGDRLRLRHLVGVRRRSIPTSAGPSWPRCPRARGGRASGAPRPHKSPCPTLRAEGAISANQRPRRPPVTGSCP